VDIDVDDQSGDRMDYAPEEGDEIFYQIWAHSHKILVSDIHESIHIVELGRSQDGNVTLFLASFD
jgi:hypothetical protein